MDASFYSEATVKFLDRLGARFTPSLPFERFYRLKEIVESRHRWKRINSTHDGFETKWKPNSWEYKRCLVIVIRQRSPVQRYGPIPLDLFELYDRNVLALHITPGPILKKNIRISTSAPKPRGIQARFTLVNSQSRCAAESRTITGNINRGKV